MKEIADEFISGPTISALYKPERYGTQHVVRIGRTGSSLLGSAGKTYSWVHGVRPEKPARFQTVLGADGSIRFNYVEVPYEDGIVGLFQGERPLPRGSICRNPTARFPTGTMRCSISEASPTFSMAADRICHLISVLGNAFDLFVFHSQNREDYAVESPRRVGERIRVAGVADCGPRTPQGSVGHHTRLDSVRSCALMRLRLTSFPNTMTDSINGLWLFAHEFAHTWLAYFSYDKSGQREPLFLPVLRRRLRLPLADGNFTRLLPFPWQRGRDRPQFDHGRELLARSRAG